MLLLSRILRYSLSVLPARLRVIRYSVGVTLIPLLVSLSTQKGHMLASFGS